MDHEDRKRNFMTWYLLAAMIGVFLFQFLWINHSQVETIPYSQFEQWVNDGKIDEVTVSQDAIHGTLKQPLPDGRRAFATNASIHNSPKSSRHMASPSPAPRPAA
jgi:cell division protease FtsH